MTEGDFLKRNDGTTIDMAECMGNMGELSVRMAANYRLTADIDASITQEMDYDGDFDASSAPSGEGFLPIGTNVDKYGGSFDGDRHSISNFEN